MKTEPPRSTALAWTRRHLKASFSSFFASLLILGAAAPTQAGTWTALHNRAPDTIQLMLLLPDGTVMCFDGGGRACYKLTPDNHGSYINGTWSQLASMASSRLYFSSAVLQNGKVVVAGGEYGSGTNSAELYDPQADTWSPTGPVLSGQRLFDDSISKVIANGNLLVCPVFAATSGGTTIYDMNANTWSAGPRLFRGSYQDEASWVKLADDSILTIDPFGVHSERYIPSLNQWINDSDVPVAMYDPFGFELGAAFLLPDGRAFFMGATGHTVIYTPSGNNSPGTWIQGPDIPNSQATPDAAAAMMNNGKILCAVSPLPTSSNHFPSPTSFYEYDYEANSFAQVNAPNGSLTVSEPSYYTCMLDLPDGSVLMSQFGSQLHVYTPDGLPLTAGEPVVTSITPNLDGSYHLTGTGLNGISEGAAYGDDNQMNSNYPMVRLTDSNGNVYYCRIYQWSSTSVMTGNKVLSTEFFVPDTLPDGFYSLVVVANGNPSDAVQFALGTLVISQQPVSQTALQGYPVTLTSSAIGSIPITYQWQKNGTNISGATDTTIQFNPVQPSDAGGYTLSASNSILVATSSVATLTVVPTVPLPFALNNDILTWTNFGTNIWYGQTNISHDGVASGQTWIVQKNETDTLQTTVTGPGTLTFWWKVSSKTNTDLFTFDYNGAVQSTISGEADWRQQLIYLPAGSLTLSWKYTNASGGAVGQNRAWVDEMSFTAGGTGPFITSQPSDVASTGGSPVAFSVAANGTPALAYQWQFNGANISRATNSTFSIASPQDTNSGLYTVRITNAYGQIFSSNAALAVIPLSLVGDDSLNQLGVTITATNLVSISAGEWHNLALRGDGGVVAWGADTSGQCDVPTNLPPCAQISAGGFHSLAVTARGKVVGWGEDFENQASPPSSLSNVVAIAAGEFHSVALTDDGQVVTWGDDSAGQCDVPTGLSDVIAISAGGSHTLALKSDGTVVAWGENTDSWGLFSGQSIVPSGLNDVVDISAGEYHSMALKSDGTVAAWGANPDGETDVPSSVQNVVAISGGGAHSLALITNQTVRAWGDNLNGQCSISGSITTAAAVAAGGEHSLVLLHPFRAAPRGRFAVRQGSRFSLVVDTNPGKHYSLESRDSLATGTWQSVMSLRGNGTTQFLIDPNATGPRRFYRIVQW
jgi:hypothetical protein